MVIIMKITEKFETLFLSTAKGIYRSINKPGNRILGFYQKISKKKGFFQKEQVLKDLHTLEPTKSLEMITEEYYVKKISITLMILFAGVALTICLAISELMNNAVIDGKYISRNSYGDGDLSLHLEAKIGEEQREDMEMSVAEQKYSDKQLDEYADKLFSQMEGIILGDNKSVDCITKDMKLVSYIDGYPFHIKYSLDNTDYMDTNGKLLDAPEEEGIEAVEKWNEGLKQGVLATITVNLEYEQYKKSIDIPVLIQEKEKTKQEKVKEHLNLLIKRIDLETRTTSQLELPQEIDGEVIIWKEKKGATIPICAGFILLTILILYLSKDKDLHDVVVKRESQMLLDYPELVSKITLLTGAGLTVRNCFYRMAREYKEKRQDGYEKHYAYEEILFAVYEMESGISEIQAYENFGKRCRIQQYIKLSALLVQNLKKSSTGLFAILQEEACDSFDLRKSMAKKLGEEAGTKMLLPLIMMLGIIMIIIFYPAMTSFAS